MNRPLVIDSSVALGWSLDDERSVYALRTLDFVEAHGASAPTLWLYEIANVLALLVRRGRLDEDYANIIGYALDALAIVTAAPTAATGWRSTTTALAKRHDLTIYDASYLALALGSNAVLATTDRALEAAARAHGIAFLE